MPSNQSPLGALPARFRRQRVLIIGCGDVGLRAARVLNPRLQIMSLTSSPERAPLLRAQNITPLLGNLDHDHTLQRLAGLATRVLHLAPPPGEGPGDPRTLALVRALRRRTVPQNLVYGSTTGVYGDCAGDWVAEQRPLNAHTARGQRRVAAELSVRQLGHTSHTVVNLLRIPGIYAPDREGGTPRARLQRGTPVLRSEDDVFTNHIHANDLARACVLALWRGKAQRSYNVNDDSTLQMGEYMDLAADLFGLPRPPRVARAQATEQLSPMLLSFMSESRRMVNTRMKRELRLKLEYPTVALGLIARGGS